jgi:hypothetical protein
MCFDTWKNYCNVCICLPELFGQPSSTYDPFTLSLSAEFTKPRHPIYEGTEVTFTCFWTAIYSTAISVSEAACAVSDIRVSSEQYRSALMGQAGKAGQSATSQAGGGIAAQP